MEIIDFSTINKKNSYNTGVLRKLPDSYEFCFLPEYEMKYESFQSQSIQMMDFFLTLLELKNKTILVSVLFPLYYDTDRIREFLDYYTFSFDENDSKGYFARNTVEIVEGKLFKGKPLVIGRRGRKKLYYEVEHFIEVTEQYNQYHHIVNTGLAHTVDLEEKKPVLYLNGSPLRSVPRIDFDLSKDFIISNGQFIVADYLDDYCGTIGFYSEEDSLIPISYYLDNDTPIFIQVDEGADGSKVCVVEQKYKLTDLIDSQRKQLIKVREDEYTDDCDMRTCKIQSSTGKEISSLVDWEEFSPPAKKEKHWKEYRSAKELAKAWFRTGTVAVPFELVDAFQKNKPTQNFVFHWAIPEYETRLDGFPGGQRNHDMIIWGEGNGYPTLIAIEAKADESFGLTLQKCLETASKNPRSNLPKRIEMLSNGLFGHACDPALRYQLLHAAAGTLIEAKKRSAKQAIFLVNEFLSSETDDKKVARNHEDYLRFLNILTKGKSQMTGRDIFAGPVFVPGNENIPSDIPLYIGKISVKLD